MTKKIYKYSSDLVMGSMVKADVGGGIYEWVYYASPMNVETAMCRGLGKEQLFPIPIHNISDVISPSGLDTVIALTTSCFMLLFSEVEKRVPKYSSDLKVGSMIRTKVEDGTYEWVHYIHSIDLENIMCTESSRDTLFSISISNTTDVISPTMLNNVVTFIDSISILTNNQVMGPRG